jgi:hypothetical protein
MKAADLSDMMVPSRFHISEHINQHLHRKYLKFHVLYSFNEQ